MQTERSGDEHLFLNLKKALIGGCGRLSALLSEAAICQLTLGRHGNQNALRRIQSVPLQVGPLTRSPSPAPALAPQPAVNLIRAMLMAGGSPPNQPAGLAKELGVAGNCDIQSPARLQ
ncbi:unnamed protein product [Arctogadus glacialis]